MTAAPTASAASDTAVASASKAYRAYVLCALSLVAFLCAVDKVVITMFMEPIKKEFGLSDSQLGLLTGLAFALLGGLASIPLARWADHGNRKWIVNGSLMAWTLMTAASGVVGNFAQLLAARIGVGIGEAGCVPASHAMLGDYYPRAMRPQALGIYSGMSFLGVFGGLVAGGVLVQTVGWRQGFVVLGLIGVVVSVIFHFTVREPERVDALAEAAADPQRATLSMWRQLGDPHAFLLLVAAFSTTALAGSAVTAWLPSYFARAFTLTPMQIGLGLGVCLGLATTLGAAIGGKLASRYGAGKRHWGAGFSAAITLAVMPFYLGSFHATSPLVAFGLLFVAYLLAGNILGPVFGTLQDLVNPSARATAVAIVSVAGVVIGQGCGPLVVGVISDLFHVKGAEADGLRLAMTAMAMVNWLTVLWFWLLQRRIRALP